jgi:serine/threonine-protein kinase
VWSLGVILYRLLTGKRPFPGDSTTEVARQIVQDDPPRPRTVRPDLPRDLEAVLLKCLEKEPARRYPTARALADDLERWLGGKPVLARRRGWRRRTGSKLRPWPVAGTLLMVLVAGVGLVWLASRPNPERGTEHSAALARLRAGQPVELIGSQGVPQGQRSRIGQAGLVRSPTEAETCQLITWGNDLVEVVADPFWDAYRFSAQVRQERTFQGEVGVSFLHLERQTPRGQEIYFATLTFADQGRSAGKVALNLRRFREPKYRQKSRGLEKRFKAVPGAWRQLEVLVRPAGLTVFWEGKALGKLTAKELAQSAAFLTAPDRAAPPAWSCRGGLGLFAYESSASFRRIVVRPLP